MKISVLGVFASVCSLFIVLSVFDGLTSHTMKYYSSFDADIKISLKEGKKILYDTTLFEKIKKIENVDAISAILEQKVFASYRDKQIVSELIGVDEFYLDVVKIDTFLLGGNWLSTEGFFYPLVIGKSFSDNMSLGLNDTYNPLFLYTPNIEASFSINPAGAFNKISTSPTGIFVYPEYDSKYIFSSLEVAQELNDNQNYISSYVIKTKNFDNANKTKNEIEKIVGENFFVKTRIEQHEVAFKMMNLEKLILYFIFIIILALSLFNVVSSLVMLAVDKQSNMETMKKLGFSNILIKNIFIKEGMLLVCMGAFLGIILGIILVIIQKRFSIIMINYSYQIPYPVEFNLLNVVIVISTILILGYLAVFFTINGKFLKNTKKDA